MDNKSIIKPKPKKLNKGQDVLYRTIHKAINEKKQLGAPDLLYIYKNHVQRCDTYTDWEFVRDEKGQVIKGDDGWAKRRYFQRPYEEWQIKLLVMSFSRAIGVLVLNGYCTILPRIDLKELAN